ncbi:hypothetical protein [Coleofasciculus sp. E1-EBD-02]|uniref:hypothetical protein n=1 Tax=Coleofasciculus sp. E1-EBD-02 TaxID=3068481 RepID=UPI0032FFAD52
MGFLHFIAVLRQSGSIGNELLAWRKGKPDDSWVFPAVHGYGHLHRSIVNRVIRRLAKEAGIKGNVSRDILNDRACRLEINFRDRDRH